MATDKKNDFTLTHYLNLTAQRDTSLGQVPFFLGLKNNPPVIRRMFVEAILAAVTWEVTDVANSASATVGAADVVILSGHSATITLPSLAAGRMLVVKDKSGAAGTTGQAITVNRAGSDTIDGSNTSFSLGANFGAVMFIGGNGSEWHSIALV
jgi:hypothetical protein